MAIYTYTIAEDGVYSSLDGSQSIRWNAGTVIPLGKAIAFGLPGAAAQQEANEAEESAGDVIRGLVTRDRLAADVAAGLGMAGNRIAFLGDSMTNSYAASVMGPTEYHAWASWLSSGRIAWSDKYGQAGLGLYVNGASGKTWAQAVADVLAISPRPDALSILIGSNDLGGSHTIAEMVTTLSAAVDQFQSAGMTVILNTVPPKTGATTAERTKLISWNTGLYRYAKANGLILVDHYAVLVNTNGSGDYSSGYSTDGIHPNQVGAKVMGQAFIDAVFAARQWSPPLAMDNTTTSSTTMLPNPLLLTDAVTDGSWNQAPGDGRPDYWGVSTVFPVGATTEIADAGTDAFGNMFHITRNGEAGGLGMPSKPIAATQGDVIAAGLRFRADVDAGMLVEISLHESTGTTMGSLGNTLWKPVSFDNLPAALDTGWITVYREIVVPSASTTHVNLKLTITAAATESGELWIAQPTLRNLTALGLV